MLEKLSIYKIGVCIETETNHFFSAFTCHFKYADT
mgnify:CR=1 FL=1